MSQLTTETIEPIVRTLLHVGERVVEVSRTQVMTQIWDRPDSTLSAMKNFYEGKTIAEIRNDTTIDRCREAIDKAFATGKDSCIEYISYNNDGKPIFAYSLRVLVCHPDKDFVFLVVENISKGNEAKLIEGRWKLAIDASGQGVWDANLEAGTVFFSDKWGELFGYDAREVRSLDDWRTKIHPDDILTAEEKVREYASGKTPIYSSEIRYLCKDGSYKWILSRGVIISYKADGSPLRFIGTHLDITDRKLVEEELRVARETFSNSFNYSGTGKALLGPGGTWLEVNNVICELTGYTRDELTQMHYRDITYPEDMDVDVELIKKLVAKEISSYSIEKRYVSKDRRVISTLLTVTLLWTNSGEPKYFICDIIDITGKKEMSDELKRKNHELETTSANLLSKMAQVEEMNNIIAHNLRGPAGNIKLLSEEPDIFSAEETLKWINASSASLLSNLDAMVEVARIKLDKNMEYEDCDLSDLVNDITGQLQGVIYQNNIRLVTNFEVGRVSYPKIYLESILYNLVSNAIKYRREDIQPEIMLSAKMIDGRVRLIAKDNGLGIDMGKYGDKVFKLNQVFHQGYDSKGVGLFITKNQIESLGGTIHVVSAPNEGCEFTIIL